MLKTWSATILRWSFYLLFFLVPLYFSASTSELFEFPKMMLTYLATSIILSAWAVRSISLNGLSIPKIRLGPIGIPILLYLLSHVLSTIFSMDPHVSVWGYYSRFHEGLMASFSYAILYFAAVNNLEKNDVKKILYSTFFSAVVVSLWGAAEHFGVSPACVLIANQYNVSCWIQDVKNRVFATLGQPNWMAAYLNVVILSALGFLFRPHDKQLNQENIKIENENLRKSSLIRIWKFVSLAPQWAGSFEFRISSLCFLLFSALLFTKSRSGFLGLVAGGTIFILILIIKERTKIFTNRFLILSSFLILLSSILFGLPFSQIEKFNIEKLFSKPTVVAVNPTPAAPSSYIDIGISESTDIRKVVWEGAIKVWQRYPIFGSGVETFAYAYYKDRPIAHNMLSEWDFLYNKAHNEYLNLLATTGTVGFSAYLLIHLAFLVWLIKNTKLTANPYPLIALFSAWLSILVTNFFGFSVVIVGLFFFLIPAFSYVLICDENPPAPANKNVSPWIMWSSALAVSLFLFFAINKIWTIWDADNSYSKSQRLVKENNYISAFQEIQNAIRLSPGEPIYKDELSSTALILSLAAKQEDATMAAKLSQYSLAFSDMALAISPDNVSFVKSRIRSLYALSKDDPALLPQAELAIKRAMDLAPTDAKIHYYAGLIYRDGNKIELSINTLKETVAMKPDYRDAHFELAKLYLSAGDKTNAKNSAEFILNRIGPDTDVRKFLQDNNL